MSECDCCLGPTGEIVDFLTGKTVPDLDRERIKQKLLRFLVKEKGYQKEDFVPNVDLEIRLGDKILTARIDLLVRISGKPAMIIRCGPGSVVSRERGTIAAARILEPDHIIPLAIQASAHEAAVLDPLKKKALAYGWETIPSRTELKKILDKYDPVSLPPKRRLLEERILFAYDAHT
ncbi:type I restriction enzyme HsdR N-terminal domain-containing protein [Thermosulfuriphilus sp.]